jgi:integrase
MRRWVRRGVVTSHFVEWKGAPLKSVKTGSSHAVELAGLWGKVTPHTLRHTAATWLMQRSVPIWQTASYLGMSAQILERTYWPPSSGLHARRCCGHHDETASEHFRTTEERFIG